RDCAVGSTTTSAGPKIGPCCATPPIAWMSRRPIMDSRVPSVDPWQDIHGSRVPYATARTAFKREAGRRLGRGDVAWNRAARYARRRRMRRSLWPLIAAAFLIRLVFERRPFPAFSRTEGKAAPDGGRMSLASMPDEDLVIDRLPDPDDAGGTAGGIQE